MKLYILQTLLPGFEDSAGRTFNAWSFQLQLAYVPGISGNGESVFSVFALPFGQRHQFKCMSSRATI